MISNCTIQKTVKYLSITGIFKNLNTYLHLNTPFYRNTWWIRQTAIQRVRLKKVGVYSEHCFVIVLLEFVRRYYVYYFGLVY